MHIRRINAKKGRLGVGRLEWNSATLAQNHWASFAGFDSRDPDKGVQAICRRLIPLGEEYCPPVFCCMPVVAT